MRAPTPATDRRLICDIVAGVPRYAGDAFRIDADRRERDRAELDVTAASLACALFDLPT